MRPLPDATLRPIAVRHPDAASAAADDTADLGFEAAFAALEAAVQQLESGDLPLDGAVAAYERGLALARRCAALLEAVELKIRQVDGAGQDAGPLAL